MTLAAILFFGICFASVDPEAAGLPRPQSDSAGSAPTTAQQAPSNQTAPESTKPAPPTPPSQPPAKKRKASTEKKTSPWQNVAPAATTTCDAVPATNSSTGSVPEPAPQTGSAQAPSTSGAAKDCPPANPPAKKIVRQGGITEQSIQLAGGSSDDATRKRGEANQYLKETEDNLKKLTGRQLSSAEQSSVSQILQFVEQSKSAADDEDLERAYTLAKKARILSDDLVNPKN